MTYAPLHVHSEYSLLSGLSQTKHIAGRLEEIGVEACALTDYGTVSGAVDFQKIISGNFKPILGCDFYLSEQEATLKEPSNEKLTNQVVLAKDIEGWKKLLSLVSESNKPEHFYRKPRLGFEQFLERVSGSGKVISFSGQIGSRLANIVSESGDWKKEGIKEVERMQEVFGKGNFYIEIQLINSLVNQKAKEIGEKLREISTATGIPCVATPDSHYCKREDAHDQRVLLCTGARKSVGQIQGGIKEGLHKDISPFFESENLPRNRACSTASDKFRIRY